MSHEGIPHHWIIEEAHGRYSWGYCQVPGCEESPKQFENVVEAEGLWPAPNRPKEKNNGGD